jgi:hypothetical protein
MKNITLSADENLIEAARQRVAEHTTLNEHSGSGWKTILEANNGRMRPWLLLNAYVPTCTLAGENLPEMK